MIRRFTRLPDLAAACVFKGSLLGAALLCGAAPLTGQAVGQAAGQAGEPLASTAYPVVQPTTPSPTRLLNAALARLARDPRDMSALVDAGSAALDLGDTDAAIGFLTRAEQVAPGSGGVRARIGVAMLRANQPVEAIRWFDLADQALFSRAEMASDRGLAYDLVGDNAAAQRQYQLALAGGQNDEASRRYALSLVIAGDRRGAELVLQPLLERRDRGAWRVRTFIMAIAGQSDEAEGIARATMPADLASGISPYLRYMPRLTAAQQAAAANLGRFPRAAEIGRDDPQTLQYAALHPRAPRADAGLIPAGAALGGKSRDARDSREKRRRPGREEKRGTMLAAASPAVPALPPAATPPAVSVPWGLQPGARPASAPAAVPAPAPAPAPVPAMTPRPAPVVLSRLDVPPGTPLAPAPPPTARPAPQLAPQPPGKFAPELQVARAPATPPAPTPQLAQAAMAPPPPVPAMAPASSPAPDAPVPLATPVPSATVVALANPSAVAPRTAPAPEPSPAPAAPSHSGPDPAPTLAVAAPSDFGSMFARMFDGYKPPEQEAVPAVESVDLAKIAELRDAAAQVAARPAARSAAQASAQGATKPGPGKAKDRGDRPDGPALVSRTSDDDAQAVPPKSAKDMSPKEKAAKAKAEADKAAKEKAALDKACLEQSDKSKSGKSKSGKSKSAKSESGKGASAKDPVCKVDPDKAKKDKKAKGQPSHASRIWVQVLTGANRDVMGREWQRLQRDASALRGRKPYITPWRSNFRLLTGPFESEAAAQAFLGQLRKDGVSGFQWTSPAGQAVDSLQVK